MHFRSLHTRVDRFQRFFRHSYIQNSLLLAHFSTQFYAIAQCHQHFQRPAIPLGPSFPESLKFIVLGNLYTSWLAVRKSRPGYLSFGESTVGWLRAERFLNGITIELSPLL